MDLEIIILSEVSQTEKGKYPKIPFMCGSYKRNDANELIYKTETDSRQKINLWLPKSKGGRGLN